MSVEHMAVVLHHSAAVGTAKVVMLGIANHEGDGGAWPTIRTLARYANVDPRNVQRAIREQVAAGELEEVQRPGRSSMYRVLVACPPECSGGPAHRMAANVTALSARAWAHRVGTPDVHATGYAENTPDEFVTPGASVTPDESVTPPLTPTPPHPRRQRHPGGDAGATQTINEPTGNRPSTLDAPQQAADAGEEADDEQPKQATRRARGTRLPAGWIPPEDARLSMRAQYPGLPDEWWRREHDKFTNHFVSASGRYGVKLDWTATWRNWIHTAAERSGAGTATARPTQVTPGWEWLHQQGGGAA